MGLYIKDKQPKSTVEDRRAAARRQRSTGRVAMGPLFVPLLLVQTALCSQHSVTITPGNTMVHLGQVLNLTCASTCPQGEIGWKILDDIDAEIFSGNQSSVLHISSANLGHNGNFECFSNCGKKMKKNRVHVTVISFPKATISLEPEEPEFGQPFRVTCSMDGVHPPDRLTLVLLDGDRSLTAVPWLHINPDSSQNYTLSVEQERGTQDAEYTCEATLMLANGSVLRQTAKRHVHFRESPETAETSAVTTSVLRLVALGTREPRTASAAGHRHKGAEGESRSETEDPPGEPPGEPPHESGDTSPTGSSTLPSVDLSTLVPRSAAAELYDSTPLDEDDRSAESSTTLDVLHRGSSSPLPALMVPLGACVACVAALAFLAFLLFCICRQKRKALPAPPQGLAPAARSHLTHP
ncbi:uncharacterized protein LOC108921391 [Scleropages formosus]|uniref:uncharacterized protein LOC108921391 n=1 Tax=Scleropages formosus TaxID=113540 RepID=UPI0010FA653D|nr:uncharacterized protein LOC108921391 [Scleropages formosus]